MMMTIGIYYVRNEGTLARTSEQTNIQANQLTDRKTEANWWTDELISNRFRAFQQNL